MTMLAVENVTMRFGGLAALRNVSLAIGEREVVGLIGPNGAGKTTLFNTISGFFRPTVGRIVFRGTDVTGSPPHRLAARGLIRTFQGARTFPNLTVREGLRVAEHMGRADGRAFPLADFGLANYADEVAAALPSGVARMLGIAMAMRAGATLLLLDEPAAGLSVEETADLQSLIRQVHARGTTVLVIEHNLHFLMGLVERVVVLDAGTLVADGPPAAVTRDPRVVEAYLGAEAHV